MSLESGHVARERFEANQEFGVRSYRVYRHAAHWQGPFETSIRSATTATKIRRSKLIGQLSPRTATKANLELAYALSSILDVKIWEWRNQSLTA